MKNNLPELKLPESLNYIGVFLTLGCQLKCKYCINIPDSNQEVSKRVELFEVRESSMTAQDWVKALNRIPMREDLPITVQGGEPTTNRGLNAIVEGIPHYVDLLTNMVDTRFFKRIKQEDIYKLQRKAPYPSIRVSWHKDEMERVWGAGAFRELVRRCESLKDYGFNVGPVKAESDVGIYMVSHPSNKLPDEHIWKGKVPFETKEFLGVHDGVLYGTYAYKHSTDLISRNISNTTLYCECRTSELLLDPLGFVHSCHYHLYESWADPKLKHNLQEAFRVLQHENFEFKEFEQDILYQGDITPIGHILDPEFTMDDLKEFRVCLDYGKCVGCDTKQKDSRFQSLQDHGISHTSVEIKNINWLSGLRK